MLHMTDQCWYHQSWPFTFKC